LAAVYYQQTRFVIYANTDDKHLIYWANSDDQTREYLLTARPT
jgi:hypothetical protein